MCKNLLTEHKCKCNVTQKNYNINHFRGNNTCQRQNVIYLLSCNQCNVQYVSETTTSLSLHTRINVHSRAESGCDNGIKHFKDDCVCASFLVQITEIFSGTEYKTCQQQGLSSQPWHYVR